MAHSPPPTGRYPDRASPGGTDTRAAGSVNPSPRPAQDPHGVDRAQRSWAASPGTSAQPSALATNEDTWLDGMAKATPRLPVLVPSVAMALVMPTS